MKEIGADTDLGHVAPMQLTCKRECRRSSNRSVDGETVIAALVLSSLKIEAPSLEPLCVPYACLAGIVYRTLYLVIEASAVIPLPSLLTVLEQVFWCEINSIMNQSPTALPSGMIMSPTSSFIRA